MISLEGVSPVPSSGATPWEKNWCMEIPTMVTPMQKLMVSLWPKSTALMIPVKMVATVDEYFFKMVSAYLKKNDDRMPCIALFITRSIVICGCRAQQPGVSSS